MSIKNADLKKRIVELSYKHKLSHLGSCLTAVDIIDEIFQKKKSGEKFVLSAGHAGLALYVVLEKYEGLNAEDLLKKCGIHPDRIIAREYSDFGYTEPIDCSTGSLGQGLPIALGMALADRSKKVYCLISDGEYAEGSIWEALNARYDLNVGNLEVYMNWNGWAAYRKSDSRVFDFRSQGIIVTPTNVDYLPFLEGQDAHYHVMNEEEYQDAMEILN